MCLRHLPSTFLCFAALGLTPLHATYSIVASDTVTGQCGVAVQTDNLAVGASVPYAQAGVGAIASQFETNPLPVDVFTIRSKFKVFSRIGNQP